MDRRAILLLFAVLALASPSSPAQSPDPPPQWKQFFASDFHKGLITRAFSGISPTVLQRCPTLASKNSQINIIHPVTFAASGLPNAGTWRESFPISGCGNDTTLNFYFVAGSDEKVRTLVAFPGATRADPILQKDAFTYAYMGASVAAKDCKTFEVKNTQFDGFGLINPPTPDPGPSERLRPWHETWVLVGCGRTFAVPLSFSPDATGTTISQTAKDVVER